MPPAQNPENATNGNRSAAKPGNRTGTRSTAKTGASQIGNRRGSKKAAPPPERSLLSAIIMAMRGNAIGRAVLYCLLILLLIGINLLLSLNIFDRFFLFLGIEIILVTIAIWLYFVLRTRRSQ